MAYMQSSPGFRLDPVAKRSPEALVVLLHDLGSPAATLAPIAARWAIAMPRTAFIALQTIDQLKESPGASLLQMPPDAEISAEASMLDRKTEGIEALLERYLHSCRLTASRLVLVGFGYGGTLALHMLLQRGLNCAGVLALAAKLTRPLPRIHRVGQKVRLIECTTDADFHHSKLRDFVDLLTARGIDARAVMLAGSPLSDQAIRHGGAYLVELVATAQGGDRYQVRAGRPWRAKH